MINPSSNGWIDKFFLEQKSDFQTNQDANLFYLNTRKTGFIFGFITSFDVTDVTDIKTLDQIKHGAADSTVAHNTYYLNGYLVTAHYTEGVTIHDAQRPGNLIEVGHYDTSPFGPEVLLEGAWGVYPYFPSGTIIISDIGEGLIVLQPTYTEAAFLEGTVKDEVSMGNIIHAQIEISGTPVVDSTDIFGIFETGYHEAGTYDIIVSKMCYQNNY